ncbi:Uncharacterised protein [Klebsiella pneumoniae subsp. ozaenae]|uniref:Uncharacterized protein n=1 Tax=Klebsiella pneumoniae subsp. ozaenae TaxID=574 RepID=A0A378A8R6_KLEPO|nr:Uncharacterised protein [Klebsiella pneumoniae subsp. ozaenae]
MRLLRLLPLFLSVVRKRVLRGSINSASSRQCSSKLVRSFLSCPQVFEVMLFRREFGHGLRPEQGLTLSAARRLRYTLARRQDC